MRGAFPPTTCPARMLCFRVAQLCGKRGTFFLSARDISRLHRESSGCECECECDKATSTGETERIMNEYSEYVLRISFLLLAPAAIATSPREFPSHVYMRTRAYTWDLEVKNESRRKRYSSTRRSLRLARATMAAARDGGTETRKRRQTRRTRRKRESDATGWPAGGEKPASAPQKGRGEEREET